MAKSKKKIAIETAIAYFGFSSKHDAFPRGTEVTIYEGDGRNSIDPTTKRLNDHIETLWNDNVGTLSRTARLGGTDITQIATSIDLKPTKAKVEKWMRGIADMNTKVVLVEVFNKNNKKLLLVNLDISL